MRLSAAATHFDTLEAFDAYSGAFLFKVQAATFLESAAEGNTASRRVISLAPALVLPPHRCLKLLDTSWVVGWGNADEWNGKPIRYGHWTKRVTDNFQLLTPAQAIKQTVGTLAMGSRLFVRSQTEAGLTSDMDPLWKISLSSSAGAQDKMFLQSSSGMYRIRLAYSDVDGFLSCSADSIEWGVTALTVRTTGAYDPVTDQTVSTSAAVSGIFVDYAKAFAELALTDQNKEPGDFALLVAKSDVTPVVGQEIEVAAGQHAAVWRVLAVAEELDAWRLHVRRLK